MFVKQDFFIISDKTCLFVQVTISLTVKLMMIVVKIKPWSGTTTTTTTATASTTVTQVRRTEAMLMLLGLEDVRYAHSDSGCEDDGYAAVRPEITPVL